MSKSEKLAKNPLLPIVMESLTRLDEILQIMTDPLTEFPAAENSEWCQDYFAYTYGLEDRGLFDTHILKLEAPPYSSAANPECLVCNQTKSVMAQIPHDETIMIWLEGRPQVYMEARIWVDGTIQLVRLVDDKAW